MRARAAVHACTDGQSALEAWQAQPFELVITDRHMPGMDGFALARAIRADACPARAQVPIIALTASVMESTREACRAAGIDHFLAAGGAARAAGAAGGTAGAGLSGPVAGRCWRRHRGPGPRRSPPGRHRVPHHHRRTGADARSGTAGDPASGHDTAVGPAFHAVLGQPCRNGRREAEGDDHHVGLQQRFAAIDRHRVLAFASGSPNRVSTTVTPITSSSAPASIDSGRRLNRKRTPSSRALATSRAAGHVGFVAAVGAGDLGRAQPYRAAHAVHAGIATAEHHHALAVEIGQGDGVFPAGNRPALRSSPPTMRLFCTRNGNAGSTPFRSWPRSPSV